MIFEVTILLAEADKQRPLLSRNVEAETVEDARDKVRREFEDAHPEYDKARLITHGKPFRP
jgi:hypothetical protein